MSRFPSGLLVELAQACSLLEVTPLTVSVARSTARGISVGVSFGVGELPAVDRLGALFGLDITTLTPLHYTREGLLLREDETVTAAVSCPREPTPPPPAVEAADLLKPYRRGSDATCATCGGDRIVTAPCEPALGGLEVLRICPDCF